MKYSTVDLTAVRGALSLLEAVVQGHRGLGKEFNIVSALRIDAHYYNGDEYDKGEDYSFQFELKHHIRKGSRYVAVDYRPRHFIASLTRTRDFYGDDIQWINIADHDSCWREDVISSVFHIIREKISSQLKWDVTSPFFNCECVRIEEVK